MQALPLILGALALMAIAYRFYSAFLASYVAALDDSRVTPAHRLNDGQNYHPTHKWVLFGHHFAAISGAGPLIGPVLAIQFGYMPGLVWLIVGVCLAGAVQDMLVMAVSVRHEGKSLAEIARQSLGRFPGAVASVAILFIVVVALSGLGVVVVKALGGEEIRLASGTILESPSAPALVEQDGRVIVKLAPNSAIQYPSGAKVTRSETFQIAFTKSSATKIGVAEPGQPTRIELGADVVERIKGSSWGTFTIACTIPIALFVGWYMYKLRKGRVMEASLLGAAGVLAATVAGNWIPGSALEPYFSFSRNGIILAICLYGFIASVLPVWILLCPRDYISSFLKTGTIALLVVGIIVANPKLEAPAVNAYFAGGGGPYFNGAIFPFVFICIMCGAVSGFHALVSSGTTPKMIDRETHIRPIGYGAMLLEGLVGIVALLAAASLPQGDYWAINIDLSKAEQYADTIAKMGANVDHLPELERQVGGESLRGRTGGAVTLAVGMAQIMTQAMQKVSGSIRIDEAIKYWYHFAIMFEALFILTTIDTGTRIARFLLQEFLGKFHRKFEKVDWLPGVILSTGLVTAAWGGLIITGSIETIWPMFGIANQLLAAIALTVVTTVLVRQGKRKYIWVTLLPLIFVTTTTLTAATQMVSGRIALLAKGWQPNSWIQLLQVCLIVFLVTCFAIIVLHGAKQWLWQEPRRASNDSAN